MESKKNIGKLFRENLDQLDYAPSSAVWEQIELDLDKKKKRRIVPFWFSYVGIFSAGILFSWLIFNNSFYENNFFNLKENSIKTKEKKNGNQNSTNFESSNNKTNSNDSVFNTENNSSVINKEKIFSNDKIVESKAIVKTNSKVDSSNKKATKNKIANFSSKNKSKRNKSYLKTKKLYNYKEKVASTNESSLRENNDFISETNSKETFNNSFSKKEFAGIENKNSGEEIKFKTTAKDSLNKKKTIKEITKNDSLTKEIIKDKTFTVFVYGSPTIPVFSDNKSSLDNRLNSNSKKAEITFSYGAYLCFYGTKNLSLRIGIGKNNLKYTTQNISVNTFNYSNIDYANGFSNAIIYSQSNNSEYMNIIQDISYIEIPLEAKYKFLNSKIGINAIFGINYSLLDKNEVSIKTEKGFSTIIGKTSNLLNQTFGANIGLGFDYKLSKNIKLNIEPMLKYQLRNNQEETKNNSFNLNILTGIEFNIFNNK